MKAKILKLDKDNLLINSDVLLDIEYISGLSIGHVDGGIVPDDGELPFSIEVVKNHVPYIKEEEFMIVTKDRIDLAARGINSFVIAERLDDIGGYKYNESAPYAPVELPPGFIELKGEK